MGTAVEVRVDGQLPTSNIGGYTVTEMASPLDPNDSTGGVGSFTYTVLENERPDGSVMQLGHTADLEDGTKGTTQGTISGLSGGEGVLTVTADSRLALLLAERQVAPFTGTLGSAFAYYLSVAGITERIVIDNAIATIPVVLQGYNGVLWDFLNKQLCPAYRVEISLVSDAVVLRPIRSRIVTDVRDTQHSWNVANPTLAQTVEVYYYNNRTIANQLVYPNDEIRGDVPVLQVDAGETVTIDIEIETSLTSIQQPQIMDYVGPDYFGPNSVYSISGSDGLPITSSQWINTGGSLSVAIGADTKSIVVTLTGSSIAEYAPYHVAVASGSSNYYSSLRLIGSGVQFNKRLLTVRTGASASETAVIVGATVDNPAISTLDQAFTAGRLSAASFSAPTQTLSVASTNVNRVGDQTNVRYPTYNEFGVQFAAVTYNQFATYYPGGTTYDGFSAIMYAAVRLDFANQAFGNVAGARVKYREAWYRIRSATITESLINYTAEEDTIFTDFGTAWAGKTYNQFATRWAGKTYKDYEVAPLWT